MPKHDPQIVLRSPARAAPASGRAERGPGRVRQTPRRAAERVEQMFEGIGDGLAVFDRDWRITYLNACAGQFLHAGGAPPPSFHLLGLELWQAFPELRAGALETQFRRAAAQQQAVAFELYQPIPGRWLEVRAFPSAAGLSSYIVDISARKAGERALREHANRLQVALAAGKLGDWSWDAATGLITIGRRAAELFELPSATPLTWGVLRARLVEEDREPARRAFRRAWARRADCDIECRVRRRGGARSWLSIVGHGSYGDDGRLRGMTGMVQDISVRKAAEDTLRQNEEELRALADSIPQLAWIANCEGAMIWYNARWYDYTGTTPQQMAADWRAAYPAECLPQMTRHWSASLRSGQPFEMEFPIRGADGQFRWFLTRANPVRDRAGRLLRWLGTSTDVDQVKRVQEALRDESNVLELLNRSGTALARTLDLRALLQEITDAATRLSGARVGAFFYNGAPGAAPTLCGADAAPFGQYCGARAASLFEPGRRLDGALRSADLRRDARYARLAPHWGQAGMAPLRSYLALAVTARSGAVLGALFLGHPEPAMFNARTERIIGAIAAQAAIALDNTRLYEAARQAAEERKVLLDSERGARTEAERSCQMKDEFLATLSHELRTPLSAILGWSQVLRRGTRDQADLHRGLQTIERNARAQAQLIEDLLDMSRITSGKVRLEMHTLAPAALVEAAVEALRPAAEAKHIRVEQRIDPDTGAVAGDPSRLQQVIWNLLSNALKFTPMQGRVQIAVRPAGALHVEISIADNGVGIAPEFLAHVFERFRQGDASTTRQHGGLGLGLAIVKHLVEQHGGTVAARSAGAGLGACFTLQLPLATEAAPPLGAAAGYAPLPNLAAGDMTLQDLSGLKVLVVDDEADARELIKRILSDCHAEVYTAASAAQALHLLLKERPALLLSDIGMPDIDGFELLALARALGPARGGDLPAIALTAFARSEDRLRALEAGFAAHVSKPVEPSQLIAAAAAFAPRRS
jgi:PAS domain S-box-containing protein